MSPGRAAPGRAALGMVAVTLLWSTAGVVSRQLEAAASFEVTCLRSAFNALALGIAITALRGARAWQGLLRAPRVVWLSGACWAVMFTAFMIAITMTRVANVLVTMAIGPLLTALFARVFLRHHLPARTWFAIAVAGAGIAWMFGSGVRTADAGSLAGMAVALAVPFAAALNYTTLHHAGRAGLPESGWATEAASVPRPAPDMLVAVLIGAVVSALVTLPFALPFRSTPHDLAILAGLGLFQLAVPCLLLMWVTRSLPAPEVALIGLLEVIFGVLWAWLGAGEAPGPAALVGGALVVGALAGNEWFGLRAARPHDGPGGDPW